MMSSIVKDAKVNLQTDNTILLFLSSFTEKHWILSIIGSILSAIWLPFIIKYCGDFFGLIDAQGHLTGTSWVLSFVIYGYLIFLLICTGLKAKYKDSSEKFMLKRQLDEKASSLSLYERVVDSIYDISGDRYHKLLCGIESYKENEDIFSSFQNSSDPKMHLATLSKQIRDIVFEATELFKKTKLVVSLAYKITDSEWEYIDKSVAYGGLDLSILSTNKETVFFQALQNSDECAIVFDKEKAAGESKYVFDNRDAENRNIGSIMCKAITVPVKDQKAYIVLSIASYGKKFLDSDDEEEIAVFEDNLKSVITQFSIQIRYEFATLIFRNLCFGPED